MVEGRSRGQTVTMLVAAAIPFVIGLLIGYQVAFAESEGLGGGIGGSLAFSGLAIVIGVIGVLGVIGLLVGGGARRASILLWSATGLLIAGGVVGYVLTPVLGLDYQPPETRVASGMATVRLDDDAFVTRGDAPVRCSSEGDAEPQRSVTGRDFGQLRSGTLHIAVALPLPGESDAEVELWVADADPPAVWLGFAEAIELSDDGTSGLVVFDRVARSLDTAGAPEGEVEAWPATISGSIAWTCRP